MKSIFLADRGVRRWRRRRRREERNRRGEGEEETTREMRGQSDLTLGNASSQNERQNDHMLKVWAWCFMSVFVFH